MKNLEHLFPSMPDYRGYWHSVLLEPIIGSGERITVIVVAIGSNAEFKVKKVLNIDILKNLYGNNAFKIENMINWLEESIENELKNKGHLNSWEVPFQGVELRDKSDSAASDIDGILNQAILFTSSFAKINSSLYATKKPKKQKWTNNMLNQIKTYPLLKTYVNKKISIDDRKVTYHFLTGKYVANFSQLLVERNDAAGKIFDLEMLKKTNSGIKLDNYEIIIETSACPSKYIQIFKDIASDNGIGVVETNSEKESELIDYLLQKVA